MGTFFVTIDNSNGFWMRDEVLELWVRLLSLHIDESPDENFLGRKIRDQWLLASRGYFRGYVPHDLEVFMESARCRSIIRDAITSLLQKLKNATPHLDGPTLNLLGIDGTTFVERFETWRLIEVGEAFLNLMDGKINSDVTSTQFMPGSRATTSQSAQLDPPPYRLFNGSTETHVPSTPGGQVSLNVRLRAAAKMRTGSSTLEDTLLGHGQRAC